MRAIRITLTALALLAILAQSAQCEQVWLEQQITSDHTWPTSGVRMWDDQIYWNDRRSGKGEVYIWDEAGGERPLVTSSESLAVWSAYEGKLAVTKYVNSQYDLYLWDEVSGMQPVSTAPGNQWYADSYGQAVVWEDYRSGDSRVYIWDPVNGERRITSAESHQVNPQIWNGQVVYEDWRQGQPGIYMWSESEGERFIGYGVSPAIHEGKVVAWELAQETQWEVIPGHLWEWTLQGGYRELWEGQKFSRPYYMNLWGDLVVWSSSGPGGVAAWHPSHGMMQVNESSLGNTFAPSVYGDKVAWVGNYNVYVSTLVPEPSSLLALGGCMCALFTCASRRRKRGIAGGEQDNT